MNVFFDKSINSYLLDDYHVAHDIRLFPPGAHARIERVMLSTPLMEIFDRLSLENCFFAAVESIMRTFWTPKTDENGVVHFYNDCDCEYHGFLDGDYFLSCNEFFNEFKDLCLSMGIEMNWPEEYLFAVLAQKKLIIPPHSEQFDSLTYFRVIGIEPHGADDFIRIKKELIQHLYVEYKESHE